MNRVWLVLTGSLLIAAQAQAQTMYRCGSVYQDRPCDAGKTGKVVGSTGTGSAPATQAGGVDPECVQRGKDSHKIVWAREGGATEERLLSEATSARERRLIQNVYRRPGAATAVQAAVEADCVAEKQREGEQAAIAIAAALKAQKEGAGAPAQLSAQPGADPQAQEQAAKIAAQERAAREADYKKKECARYGDQMESLRRAERAGGSASRMDSLNEQRRDLRERMSKAGC
jgi:hypothetical protein